MIIIEKISNYIKDIKDIYYINIYGEIYSLAKQRPILLKGKKDKDGYKEYGLYDINNNRKHFRGHRIMGAVYLGLELNSDLEINHKNGIKHDNRLVNLEVVTSSENKLHSIYVLKNDTTRNLPDNRTKVRLYDKCLKKDFIFCSIREMCNNYSEFNYDYIANRLSKYSNFTYKKRYQISKMGKESVTTIESTSN